MIGHAATVRMQAATKEIVGLTASGRQGHAVTNADGGGNKHALGCEEGEIGW
jgi:hypothetical protein